MQLFEVPKRTNNDSLITQKAREKPKKTAVTVRGNKSLVDKISAIREMVERSLGQYRDKYIVIQDLQTLNSYVDSCIENKYIAIDTETDGLDPMQNVLAGICIYTKGEKAAYIPLNHISYITNEKVDGQLSMQDCRKVFERLLEAKPTIDMFNAKFDIRFLRNQLDLKDIYCTWDGYLASRLLNENEPQKGLKALHNKYCLDGKGDAFKFDELFKGIPFTMIPINVGYLYAAHDPEITCELCDYQRQFLDPNSPDCAGSLQGVSWVFHNIEMPCLPIVADMEDNGVEFDFKKHAELSEKYHALLEKEKQNLYSIIDEYSDEINEYRKSDLGKKLENPINLSSTTQIAILLYDIFKLDSGIKNNPRGTGSDILKRIDHPVCKALLKYREFSKLISAFIDSLPGFVNKTDGRIHCNFNQYGADTGRMSCQNPNLQQIPSKNHEIRQMFKASDGCVLMSSDYSQQEVKVMAQMCQDEKMIDAFIQGKDFYSQIASLSFGVPYEQCLEFNADGTTNKEGKSRRTQAKSVLLGLLYGRGEASIGEQLGVSVDRAREIKQSVFRGFPAIQKFENDSLNMAYELGYVTTLWGRKRRLPEMQLDEFEFKWKDGVSHSADVLDFDEEEDVEIPQATINKYLRKLQYCRFGEKRKVFEEANKEGIWIVDNGAKISDATRQCVNARIQGSAADMSKLAMISVGNDKRLKELGFRLLIPVHDELIGECPIENAKECAERFSMLMSKAAETRLKMPIKCDVSVSREWYGEEIEI